MFDTTCANRKAFNAHGIERPPSKWVKSCRVGFVEWEEHCVECGQPECFRTCKMFERSYDGKCRRFACGIVKLRGLGYGIKFKQWGKIEGVYTGRYISRRTEAILSCIDGVLSKCAQYVNRIMAFIPGRIGAITIYRRIKLWSERLIPGDKSKQLHGTEMRVFADESVELHLVLIADEQEKFSTVIHLESGWNEIGVETPAIVRGARILLFSTSSKEFTLVFDSLELVQRVNRGEDKQLKTQICASLHAKYVKCVAWDLDNTVWSGILVEDGVEGLRINENVINTIKSLDRRGIVNTVMSKNDYDCAWKCLEKFGISEYFVFPHINWIAQERQSQSFGK